MIATRTYRPFCKNCAAAATLRWEAQQASPRPATRSRWEQARLAPIRSRSGQRSLPSGKRCGGAIKSKPSNSIAACTALVWKRPRPPSTPCRQRDAHASTTRRASPGGACVFPALLLCSLFPGSLIVQANHPGAKRLCFDQLQRQRPFQRGKERDAAAQHDRVDVQPIVVDQSLGDKTARQAGAANQNQVLARLLL